ncbi:hypothetical protein [Arthrobacter sp. IK3]|uniref:hypothetical protein n=1 Tax=Arthrobacter sp. IK3 TaxID=3448169 RepID=UPI003EE3FE0C
MSNPSEEANETRSRGLSQHFPPAPASPEAQRARLRMEELCAAASRTGLSQPAIFNGLDPQAGEMTAVWQYSTCRITAYLANDVFEVELVPMGPPEPFTTSSTEAAAAFAAGIHASLGGPARDR